MPKAATDRTAELREALDVALRDYAARRAEYTADLIRCEARVRRLEAEIRLEGETTEDEGTARLSRADAPKAKLRSMPALAPLPRPHGWGRRLPPGPLVAVGNLARWAREHGLLYSTVKRWKTRGKSGTRIPQEWAAVFYREYSVPLDFWPRGILPPPGPRRPPPTRPYRPRRRKPR